LQILWINSVFRINKLFRQPLIIIFHPLLIYIIVTPTFWSIFNTMKIEEERKKGRKIERMEKGKKKEKEKRRKMK